ncbi:MAG: urea transporter [Bdellovibrionaceae bacterium]|nr:urea transporter [Pseudobdellovibrionaceae bacterium]
MKLSLSMGLGLLIGFSALWIFLGLFWGRKNKSFEDHALAGRNVGLALGAATAAATWITSNTTMLAPQFALQMGVWGMIAYSSAALGLILFAPLASRIQILMPQGYTSGDFVRLRFGQKTWVLYLILTLFYSLAWLVSMAMAGGVLLQTLSGIPYVVGMSVILFVCVVYTMIGGLNAVIGTDFIQSVIILVGIILVAFVAIDRLPVSVLYESVSMKAPKLLDVFFPAAILTVCNNFLFGLGEVFHNNVWWSRAFAMRRGVAGKAFFFGGLLWLPVPVVAGFIALAIFPMNLSLSQPDTVGPLVVSELLGKGGAVAIFIIVFCSLASSIDSLLASLSDLITEDILSRLVKQKESKSDLRRFAQWVTVVLGIVTWFICLPHVGSLAEVLFFAGPLVASMIWPMIAGLFWDKLHPEGAFWAILLGSTLGLIAYFMIGWYVASLIGATVSMFIMVAARFYKPISFDWNQLKGGVSR